MALSSNLTTFSDVTDGAPLSPAYLNSKFGVLDKNILQVNTDGGGGLFNVKDAAYGATGDGSTDDGAAIQAAIDAAEAVGGGQVYFPRGTYNYATGLTVQANNVYLLGEGRDVSILDYDGSGVAVTLGTTGTPIFRWKVADLTVQDSGTATKAFQLEYAREGSMVDVRISVGFSDTALYLAGNAGASAGCWTNRFTRLHIVSTDGDGVFLGAQSNAVMFEGCRITANGGDNVLIHYANGVVFRNSQFENAVSGIEIRVTNPDSTTNAINNLTIDGNYFETRSASANAADRALYVIENTTGGGTQKVEGLMFSNNYVFGRDAADYGMECDNGTKCFGMAVGNFFHGINTAGIRTVQGNDRIGIFGNAARADFGGGSALPLSDNNSGAGAGASLEIANDAIRFDRKFDLLTNDGQLSLATHAATTNLIDTELGLVFTTSGMSLLIRSGSSVYDIGSNTSAAV